MRFHKPELWRCGSGGRKVFDVAEFTPRQSPKTPEIAQKGRETRRDAAKGSTISFDRMKPAPPDSYGRDQKNGGTNVLYALG